MNKLKKIIIILILFILIMVILIIKLKKNSDSYSIMYKEHLDVISKSGFSEVEDYTTYYTIKEIINNYILYMKQINGDQYIEKEKLNMSDKEISKALQDEGISAIKEILDKQYIEDMSINDQLIKENANKYKKNGDYSKDIIYDFEIEELERTYFDENISIIIVNSQLNNKELNIIIKLDKLEETYSIFLEDYIKKYNYNKDMNKDDININDSEIEKTEYNSYMRVDTSDKNIVSQYFSEYRMKMLNNTEKAYELLDEEYKKVKFGNYENFEKYVKDNKNQILYGSINKYQTYESNGIKEYVCIDNNGKYYIFNENNVINYDVILDTYTIDLPEFLEKYNSNSDDKKAGMNIQKIFDAINDSDFGYAYKKLDSTFKQNNFPTEELFEKYAKQYLLNTQVKYDNCEKNGEIYIYDVTLTKDNGDTLKKKFIVKLLEGTDYVFSLNIQ